MRTTMRILFGLGVVGVAWAGTTGCASGEKVIQPVTNCFGYEHFGYWHSEEPPSVTVCTDGEQPVTLQFKGPDGTPVPGGGHLSAPGCVTVPFPAGAETFDWVTSPPPKEPDPRLLMATPGLPSFVPVWGVSVDTHEYTFGCSTLKLWSTGTARTYVISAMATSLAEAQAMVNPILYHGPGSSVPPGVKVGAYIEAQRVGLDLVIRSSLHGRFDHFLVDIDGQPVADLEADLNVQSESSGSGWTMVTATLPLYLLSDTMDLNLRQQGRNDPNELQLIVDF